MPIAVILVEPEIGENIGFVARAMRCYGLTDLRIVTTSPLPDAMFRTGSSAREILENCVVFSTLQEAIAPFTEVIAFSRRPSSFTLPHISLQDLSLSSTEHTALLFGRESQGLFQGEIALATKICEIPLVASTMSLNLGQAVATALYHLSSVPLSDTESPLATSEERQALFSLLQRENQFLEKGSRKEQLSTMIAKMELSSDELSMFMGVIKGLK